MKCCLQMLHNVVKFEFFQSCNVKYILFHSVTLKIVTFKYFDLVAHLMFIFF